MNTNIYKSYTLIEIKNKKINLSNQFLIVYDTNPQKTLFYNFKYHIQKDINPIVDLEKINTILDVLNQSTIVNYLEIEAIIKDVLVWIMPNLQYVLTSGDINVESLLDLNKDNSLTQEFVEKIFLQLNDYNKTKKQEVTLIVEILDSSKKVYYTLGFVLNFSLQYGHYQIDEIKQGLVGQQINNKEYDQLFLETIQKYLYGSNKNFNNLEDWLNSLVLTIKLNSDLFNQQNIKLKKELYTKVEYYFN